MKVKSTCLVGIVAVCIGATASGYDLREGPVGCYTAHCSGADDCLAASRAVNECDKAFWAKRHAEEEAKHQEYLRQHQAELDMAKKIEEANKALNPH